MAAKNKAKMERFETLRSPKGIAGFSYLREPDESFGQSNHRIQLFGKKDDKKVPALKKADEYMATRFGEYGVKEGDLYFEFKSKARKNDDDSIRFVDIHDSTGAMNQELRVFGGDIIRVSVTLMGYKTGENSGVKPYLNAVQVLQKKNNGGGRVNVFEDESAENPVPEAAEGGEEGGGEEAPFEAEGEPETPAPTAPVAAKPAAKGKAAAKPAAAAPATEEGEVDVSDLL
jgi:hypothetical protein